MRQRRLTLAILARPATLLVESLAANRRSCWCFMSLDHAITTLEKSLAELEAAAQRKLSLERSRGDLETELSIMQDDRARLATELDGALARVRTLEGAAKDTIQRIDKALAVLEPGAGG
jgi:chromosome segregation ATPase